MMIHPLSDVKSQKIGRNTRVWQYAIILEQAEIGEDCNINCHTFIENNVVIGNNVTVKSGVYLWDGTVVKDNAFIGPNVTFTNDKYPRSKRYPDQFLSITIGKGASIGAAATLLGGITVGEYALVAAGSLVTKDVPAFALVAGSPARIIGWVDEEGNKLQLKDNVWYSKTGTTFIVNNNSLTRL